MRVALFTKYKYLPFIAIIFSIAYNNESQSSKLFAKWNIKIGSYIR